MCHQSIGKKEGRKEGGREERKKGKEGGKEEKKKVSSKVQNIYRCGWQTREKSAHEQDGQAGSSPPR